MACRIENINNKELKDLVEKYGATEGLKLYLNNKSSINKENVDYKFKLTNNIFNNLPKVKGWIKQLGFTDKLYSKLQQDLQIPKEQIELFKEAKGDTIEDKLIDFISKYSYTVKINTATEYIDKRFPFANKEEYEKAKKEGLNLLSVPTQHYSNLTVPGGTNYTENEISTPLITPSIKGHAEFSTYKGIGWFRSDEVTDKYYDSEQKAWVTKTKSSGSFEDIFGTSAKPNTTKTRRILEIQSDLFQKGRDKDRLVKGIGRPGFQDPRTLTTEEKKEYYDSVDEYEEAIKEWDNLSLFDKTQNQFLQLLNKDNNWVTFFIKSIVQDSAKKGYEKVLFPKGETAAKIEGHETITDEIESINKQLEDKRKYLDIEKKSNSIYVETLQDEISKLEQRKATLKSQGIEKLKPIEAFYEIKVGNILEKQFGKENVKTITDEHGNKWREITIKPERDLSNISFLIDPNQTELNFEENNKEKEITKNKDVARKQWENLFEKGGDKSYNNLKTSVYKLDMLPNKIANLLKNYPALTIEYNVNPNNNNYYEVYIHNPDYAFYNSPITVKRFTEESHLIKPISSVKKNNPIKEMVIREKMLINLLYSKLNEAKSGSNAASNLKARITKLEEHVEKLVNINQFSAVLDVGNLQATEISNKLKAFRQILSDVDSLSDSTLHDTISSLEEIKHYISTWLDLNEVFDIQPEEEYITEFSNLVGKFSGLKNTYGALIEKALTAYVNRESFGKYEQKDIFGDLTDTSYIKMQFLGINHSDTELLRIANDIMKKALFKTDQEMLNKSKEITNAIDKLVKFTRKSKLDSFKQFLQFDDKGNWTGNLVTEYSQKYWDELKKLSALKKAGTITYTNWYNKIASMHYKMTEDIVNNNDTTHFTQEEIDAQKELLKIYKKDLEAYEESIRLSGEYDIPGEDTTDEAAIQRALDLWKKKYSPYLYWNSIKQGDFKSMSHYAKDYILDRDNGKAKEEWHDKEFQRIMSIPELKEFYLFMVKTFTDNTKELPKNFRKQRNYLPETQKTYLEKLKEDRGLFILKGIPKQLVDSITTEETGDYDYRVNIAGQIVKSIPVRMMDNKMDVSEKSMDLETIMLAHTGMSLNYKYKAEILPVIRAMQERLDEMSEVKLNNSGTDYQRGLFGVKQNLGKKLTNTKQHLAHTIDAWMFGEYKDEWLTSNKGFFLSKEEKEEKVKLEEKLSKGEITQEEFDSGIKNLGKKISGDEIGDSLIRLTYLKALSFPNVVSPAVNMFFGVLSNISYAAGGKDFTDTEIIKATGILMKAISKTVGGKLHMQSVEKVYAWMHKLNLLGELNESMYGRKMSLTDKAVFLQMKAETINQGSVMVAMLMNKKIKDLSGKEVSLWNAYKVVDGELVFDEERFGKQEGLNSNNVIEGVNVNMYRLSNQVKAVVQRIHGDYTQPMRVKRNIFGRILILFRTWLPATLNERFQGLDYDADLGREVKGRYISIFNAKDNSNKNINLSKSLSTFAKLVLTQNYLLKGVTKKSLNSFSEVDSENLKRAAREAQVIITLFIVGLLLKSLGSDDDDEKKGINLLANTLNKTNADLMFFFNPGAMMNVAANPIPILKTINDFGEIIPMTIKTLQGEPYYQNGPWKDHLRYEKWLYNNIPIGGSAMVRLNSLMDKQYDYINPK